MQRDDPTGHRPGPPAPAASGPGGDTVLAALAHRLRARSERQQLLTERLRSGELRPGALADLAELAAAARRGVRDGDHILVMSGTPAADRGGVGPVPLGQSLSAAVSASEAASRTVVPPTPGVSLDAATAPVFGQILAELLAHATTATAPGERLELHARSGPDGGLVVELLSPRPVSTRTPAEELDRTLASGRPEGPVAPQEIGLHLAARLARALGGRLGVLGTPGESAAPGLSPVAVLHLPPSALTGGRPDEVPGRPAEPGAPEQVGAAADPFPPSVPPVPPVPPMSSSVVPPVSSSADDPEPSVPPWPPLPAASERPSTNGASPDLWPGPPAEARPDPSRDGTAGSGPVRLPVPGPGPGVPPGPPSGTYPGTSGGTPLPGSPVPGFPPSAAGGVPSADGVSGPGRPGEHESGVAFPAAAHPGDGAPVSGPHRPAVPGPDRSGPDRQGPPFPVDRSAPGAPGPGGAGPGMPGPGGPGPDRPGRQWPEGQGRPGPIRPAAGPPGAVAPGSATPGSAVPGSPASGPPRPGSPVPGPPRPAVPGRPDPARNGAAASGPGSRPDPQDGSAEQGGGPVEQGGSVEPNGPVEQGGGDIPSVTEAMPVPGTTPPVELFGPFDSVVPVSMDDLDGTPIFAAVASAWFRDPTTPPSGEPGTNGAPRPAGEEPPNWSTVGDAEFDAARNRANRVVEPPVTVNGLPVRRPGQQMVPPSRREVPPPGPVRRGGGDRQPERVRNRLASYQRGLREGRHRAAEEQHSGPPAPQRNGVNGHPGTNGSAPHGRNGHAHP